MTRIMTKKTQNNFEAFLRILDANYNRAKEALRVAEDLARFLMEDKILTAKFKKLRHDLTKILLRFPVSYRRLVAARDSVEDVGKKSLIHDTPGRTRWQDLLTANLKRAQEAMRVLEEVSKVVAPRESGSFQHLRFSLYELEKRTLQKF